MLPRIPVFAIYTIIFLTGAAGLIYQVTWQRYLSRLLGSDSIATAIILAVFLGGLSVGYGLCGKLSTRIKNQLKAYAVAEGLIGVWCLFFPQLYSIVASITASWSFSPPITIIVQGFFCSALLMGPPTVCMGSTIPFLTRGISRSLSESTGIHASIYAINTAGAFLGTLLAGFWFIPQFGLPLTMMGTALLNLASFAAIYIVQKWIPEAPEADLIKPDRPATAEPAAAPADKTSTPYLFYAIAFLSGFYVMTFENVLIRITNLTIGSSSYSFSLIISVFILSIAIGSYAVGRVKRLPRHSLFTNQFLIALLLLGLYMTLDMWPYFGHLIRISIQSTASGFWLYYVAVFFAMLLILSLPVALMGATVPLVFHEVKQNLRNVGKHSGYLFSINTIGNLSGSLIGGILLFYMFDIGNVFLAATLMATVSTVLAAVRFSRKSIPLAGVVATLAVIFMFTGAFFDPLNFAVGVFRKRVPFPYSYEGPAGFFEMNNRGLDTSLKFQEDGPTASVTAVEYVDQETKKISHSIFVNGKSDSNTSYDGTTLKLSAHLPALLAGKRDNVLVVGLGTGVTAAEFTLYPDVKRVDVAEISPGVIKALPVFAEHTYNVHTNDKVNIYTVDAFRHMARSKIKYDVIVSEPSNPWVTGVAQLFSVDFYQLVNEHMSDDGIFLQFCHAYSASEAMMGMIVNTARQSFKDCHIFMSSPYDFLIIGSKRPLTREILLEAKSRFDINPQIQQSLDTIDIDSFEAMLCRQVWPGSYMAKRFKGSGLQTLDNPRLHYIAGRDFFMGKGLRDSFFFSHDTAEFHKDYLLAKLYDNWNAAEISKATYLSMLRSLSSDAKVRKKPVPTVASFVRKAHRSNPEEFPLGPVEKKITNMDLLPFLEQLPFDEHAWAQVDLQDKSIREKAQVLIRMILQSRDWVTPFPIHGLTALLEKGMREGKDVSEKNWCTLQRAAIAAGEEKNLDLAKTAYGKLVKDADGKIIVAPEDSGFLRSVTSMVDQQD